MPENRSKTAREYIEERRRQKVQNSLREDPEGTGEDGRIRKKRILIMSDTHGYSKDVEPLLRKVKQLDYLIHCGDVSGDEDYIRACAAEICGCPSFIVQGNNDLWTDLPTEENMTIAGHKILDARAPLRHFLRYVFRKAVCEEKGSVDRVLRTYPCPDDR